MYSLQQAVRASPVLAQMAERVRLSQHLLEVVRPHVPPGLRDQIQAGPLDGDAWCVFVRNTAVATKLRLLTPALLAALRVDGQTIQQLRVKVQRPVS